MRRIPIVFGLVVLFLAGSALAGEQPQPQVTIEAKFVEVNWDGLVRDIGLRLDQVDARLGGLAGSTDQDGGQGKSDYRNLMTARQQLRGQLNQAQFYLDARTLGRQEPRILQQYGVVMGLRVDFQDVFSGLYEWRIDSAQPRLVPRQTPSLMPCKYLMLGRAMRDNLNAEDAKLARYVADFRLLLKANSRGGGKGCFPAGVLVLLADGTFQPIEELVPGQSVLSMDFEAGRAVPARITATPTQVEYQVLRLNGRLLTNGAHRFYTDHGLKAASEIEPGDSLLGRDAPTLVAGVEAVMPAELASLEDRLPVIPVYNLLVEGTHTFYVSPDGVSTYLVHDSCGCAKEE